VSDFFPKPDYQSQANYLLRKPRRRRGVSDVAGGRGPGNRYNVLVDGLKSVVRRSSAVARFTPVYSRVITTSWSSEQSRAPAVHQRFYQNPQAFRDIPLGTMRIFRRSGWDATTGRLGSQTGIQPDALTGSQTQRA